MSSKSQSSLVRYPFVVFAPLVISVRVMELVELVFIKHTCLVNSKDHAICAWSSNNTEVTIQCRNVALNAVTQKNDFRASYCAITPQIRDQLFSVPPLSEALGYLFPSDVHILHFLFCFWCTRDWKMP